MAQSKFSGFTQLYSMVIFQFVMLNYVKLPEGILYSLILFVYLLNDFDCMYDNYWQWS
jgi:hypothetical protein